MGIIRPRKGNNKRAEIKKGVVSIATKRKPADQLKKRGRKNVYDEKIKPYLPQIHEWAQEKTEAQIAKILDISKQTFCKYKAEHPELLDALKKSKSELVKTLYSTLIRKAEGFQYTETKTIKERDPETGQLVTVREENYTRTALPDVAALHLLLKNNDRENWADNPQMLELKKQELEIQKQKAEENNW